MTKPRRRSYCFGPGYRTGYSGLKNAPKLSLFCAPEDDERQHVWERNLHRADKPLEPSDAVCELHFEEKYILRHCVHTIDGKEVRIPRGKPSLSPDAVPTSLPNVPKYLSKVPVRERLPRKRVCAEPAECGSSKKLCLPVNELRTDGPAVDVQDMPFDLWNVPLPTEHWAAHKFTNYDGAAYVQASFNSESQANFLPRNSVGCTEHDREVSVKIISFYILTRLQFLVKRINSSNATKRQRAKHLKLSRST
ncbi:hypothetical protein HPB48_016660 [Haemaphysalis longicornis]|uniref:THAP-type domain-containing protein n=1 Tax=Haemaphysalis longicornis TaxID=44386 RepID=A0A9J6FSV9_HAELO|nr:hypothetical protein HPB48_016660 [Haemaphysalis longicornis]